MMPVSGQFQIMAALAFGLLAVSSAPAQNKTAANPDADCLACHNNKDLKSDSGQSLYVDPAKHSAGVHAVLNCTSCHTDIKEYPHPKRIAKVECATCHADQAADVPKSVHGALGSDACASCHGSAHDAQAAAAVMPKQCASCHGDEVKNFRSSVHGTAVPKGQSRAVRPANPATGPRTRSWPASDPQLACRETESAEYLRLLPLEPGFSCQISDSLCPSGGSVPAQRPWPRSGGRQFSPRRPARIAIRSHAILPGRNARSKTNHWNIPATCGACHAEIKKVYDESVHGKAAAQGAPDAPVCTDCHGEHAILAPARSGVAGKPRARFQSRRADAATATSESKLATTFPPIACPRSRTAFTGWRRAQVRRPSRTALPATASTIFFRRAIRAPRSTPPTSPIPAGTATPAPGRPSPSGLSMSRKLR